MVALARRQQRATNIWPGFVDALATLLMVIMFLLMVFVLAQFFLGQALSGRDQALIRFQNQASELAELLSLERSANEGMRKNLAELSQELQISVALRDDRSLDDGKAAYISFYHAKAYYFATAEAKAEFDNDPQKYAPASNGNDVTLMARTPAAQARSAGHRTPGSIYSCGSPPWQV